LRGGDNLKGKREPSSGKRKVILSRMKKLESEIVRGCCCHPRIGYKSKAEVKSPRSATLRAGDSRKEINLRVEGELLKGGLGQKGLDDYTGGSYEGQYAT